MVDNPKDIEKRLKDLTDKAGKLVAKRRDLKRKRDALSQFDPVGYDENGRIKGDTLPDRSTTPFK